MKGLGVKCCKACYDIGTKAATSAAAKHHDRSEFAAPDGKRSQFISVSTPLRTSSGTPMVRLSCVVCVRARTRVCTCARCV